MSFARIHMDCYSGGHECLFLDPLCPMQPKQNDTTTICEICGEDTEGDQRTVRVTCLYDLTEAGLAVIGKIAITENRDGTKIGSPSEIPAFGAVVCKDCRGDLIGLLRRWRAGEFRDELHLTKDGRAEVDAEGYLRNIPVRVDGTVRMMSQHEYQDYRASRELT